MGEKDVWEPGEDWPPRGGMETGVDSEKVGTGLARLATRSVLSAGRLNIIRWKRPSSIMYGSSVMSW